MPASPAMNILHVISAPAAGGAEIYIKDLAKAQQAMGHKVFIGFCWHASDYGRSQEFERLFLQELDGAGVSYFFIGHKARRMPWLGIWKIWRFAKSRKIDIYHTHLIFGVVFGALLRIPRIFTQHSVKVHANKLVFPVFDRILDHYVGISRICSDNLKNYTNKEITTIFNGVDLEKFRRQDKGLPRDVVQCISVGRIDPAKNYLLLLKAITLLGEDTRSRILFRIAGEGYGTHMDEVFNYARDQNLEESVQFLGNRGDIPKLLAESDLFIMSSAWEGLPISLIEATASGLPCIVTDVGGCAELIRLCQNGIVVESQDATAMAHAITRLVSNRDQLLGYSENALRNAHLFSIENAAQAYLSLYHRAMAS